MEGFWASMLLQATDDRTPCNVRMPKLKRPQLCTDVELIIEMFIIEVF